MCGPARGQPAPMIGGFVEIAKDGLCGAAEEVCDKRQQRVRLRLWQHMPAATQFLVSGVRQILSDSAAKPIGH